MKRIAVLTIVILCISCIQAFAQLPSDIWISREHIAQLNDWGPAWESLKAQANQSCGPVNLSDQDQRNNVCILAKALVFARTGDVSYRTDTMAALQSIADMGTYSGRALALGRELGAYAIAADLINLKTNPDLDNRFRDKIRSLLTTPTSDGPRSLVECHEIRPNNWGTHCGGARVAVDAYLGDQVDLARAADVFKGWLGDRASYAGFSYGDLSWQCDPSKPVGINPMTCEKQGHLIDGVLPDDQRRSGGFKWPPPTENYVYEALQGALMQAVILERAGFPAFSWENQALLRAFVWLDEQANFPAEGDDSWQPFVINYFYKTNLPATPGATSPGKNMGWTDWVYPGSAVTDPAPPISNLGASSITHTSATISWDTSVASTGLIEYGLTASYGASLDCHTGTLLGTHHSGELNGLQPESTYHFRVISEAAGIQAISGDQTFTTPPDPNRPQPPTAQFVADVVSGQAPLTVNFTDLSTGSPTSRDWDFGDGGSQISTASETATHTYMSEGRYTVTLTVSNGNGTDTVTLRNYITVRRARSK